MAKSVAVVTMVYNEPTFLPIWLGYYGDQFGETCCYVVDHGSDDGCTEGLGSANVVRIPRSPMHDKKRAAFISEFCSSLLHWYDVVIYTDVDEILVADPDVYGSLFDLTQKTKAKAVTAVGFNIIHIPADEAGIKLDVAITRQRSWARFTFAMCKPLITTVPIEWKPGFHTSDQELEFDNLFLFHLHYFDRGTSKARLAKTRRMPWGDGPDDHYQRWPDEKHDAMVDAIASLPRINDATFSSNDPIIQPYIDWMSQYIGENPGKKHHFYFNNGISCAELLRIPGRFVGKF